MNLLILAAANYRTKKGPDQSGAILEIPFFDTLAAKVPAVGQTLKGTPSIGEPSLFGKQTATIVSYRDGITYNYNTPVLNTTGDFTVEAWVRSEWTDSAITWPIIDQWVPGANPGWMFGIRNQRLVFWYASSSSIYGTKVISDNEWHHVAVARKDGRLMLFVDGVEEAQRTVTKAFNVATNLKIGVNPSFTSAHNGKATQLSRLRIYNDRCMYEENFEPDSGTIDMSPAA